MGTYYKVWAYIEEINEENDHYEDIGEPEPIGEFKTLEEAEGHVLYLHETSDILDER